ncbi:hypothetical protein U6B65_03240 [Oscillospiraceae bacterium MB08-C2-2]|nr:hypothetical protein U6B65_03240 [Oscillospiraceae bacterium MB08-C2-2]
MDTKHYYGLWLLMIPVVPLLTAGLLLLLRFQPTGYYLLVSGLFSLWILVRALGRAYNPKKEEKTEEL